MYEYGMGGAGVFVVLWHQWVTELVTQTKIKRNARGETINYYYNYTTTSPFSSLNGLTTSLGEAFILFRHV